MNNFVVKKMEKDTSKIERKGRKVIRKMKVYAIIGGVLICFVMVFTAFYNISKWYDENKVSFQYPVLIKFQSPVVIEKRVKEVKKASVMPVKETKDTDEQYPKGFEEAYDKVWLMESGRGTNKSGLNGYCISQNKINQIGYAPADKYCFENEQEQKDTFMTWLTNRINGVKMPHCQSIEQCLRVYSNGSYGL